LGWLKPALIHSKFFPVSSTYKHKTASQRDSQQIEKGVARQSNKDERVVDQLGHLCRRHSRRRRRKGNKSSRIEIIQLEFFIIPCCLLSFIIDTHTHTHTHTHTQIKHHAFSGGGDTKEHQLAHGADLSSMKKKRKKEKKSTTNITVNLFSFWYVVDVPYQWLSFFLEVYKHKTKNNRVWFELNSMRV
jgi:hypothetical protein